MTENYSSIKITGKPQYLTKLQSSLDDRSTHIYHIYQAVSKFSYQQSLTSKCSLFFRNNIQ